MVEVEVKTLPGVVLVVGVILVVGVEVVEVVVEVEVVKEVVEEDDELDDAAEVLVVVDLEDESCVLVAVFVELLSSSLMNQQ
jgi:hypothetical protein